MDVFRDPPEEREQLPVDRVEGPFRGDPLLVVGDGDDPGGRYELREVPFVEPRVRLLEPEPPRDLAVPVGHRRLRVAFEHGEVGPAVPEDAAGLPEDAPPVRHEMKDVVRGHRVERRLAEREAGSIREHDVPQPLLEPPRDHLRGDVHPDHPHPALLERDRVAACAHADFENAFPLELLREHADRLRKDPRREAAGLVVHVRDAVEADPLHHRTRHRTRTYLACPSQVGCPRRGSAPLASSARYPRSSSRYARGEISKEQFDQLVRDLSASDGGDREVALPSDGSKNR